MIHLNTWRTRVWYPAKEGAGYGDVKGLRIHSLRHTYASFAIGAGCDVKTLQSIMGHASATETLNTYAELWLIVLTRWRPSWRPSTSSGKLSGESSRY